MKASELSLIEGRLKELAELQEEPLTEQIDLAILLAQADISELAAPLLAHVKELRELVDGMACERPFDDSAKAREFREQWLAAAEKVLGKHDQ